MPPLATAVRAAAFLGGWILVAYAMLSAVRLLLLPRGSSDRMSRVVFRAHQRLFDLLAPPGKPYEARDRILAYMAPTGLLVVLVYWLLLVACGYAAVFWSLAESSSTGGKPPGLSSALAALELSGSSLLTLGFATSNDPRVWSIAFSEAVLGLILIALLISYLPTIYNAFSRRERLVNLLEVRADSPPSAIVLLTRIDRLHGLSALHDIWVQWEQWFAELEETHTSLPPLVMYRSQQPNHSWVNAAGTIMDTAALTRSVVEIPADPQADLCIRAGYLALRRIADFFGIRYPPDPRQDEQTSITRAQFDRVCAVLETSGIPLKADRDHAWLDFNGWRVNYDAVLLGLAQLTAAAPSWWDLPLASAYATDEPSQGAGA
jgi:hypothetical protein